MKTKDYKVSIPEGKSGNWRVETFEVPKISFEGMRFAMAGRPVTPGVYTRLVRNNTTIMSDTPAEIRDFLGDIRGLHGRILVNGLGLGATLKALLMNEEVVHIDVVEKSEDVIKLVASHYNDPRVTIHNGDAFEMEWPRGTQWDFAWHDIWDTLCSDNLDEMGRLHRKYGRRVNGQASWGRSICQAARRKEKKEEEFYDLFSRFNKGFA
jgi:hypothetical protein